LIAKSNAVVWRSGDATGTDSTADKITDAIKLSGEYSIEIWLQPSELIQTGPARIMTIAKSGGTACDATTPFALTMDGDDFAWRRPDGPSSCNPLTVFDTMIIDYIQYQFVVTYDGINAFIYENGNEVASDTLASSIGDWTSGYEMAIFNTPFLADPDKRPWLGSIFKIAIWDRELTPSEVITTFRAGPCYPRKCSCDCTTSFT
jgi:hypothetical protein